MKALALIPVIWLAIGLLWFFTVGQEVANGQEALPEQSSVLTVCQTARSIAQMSGVNLEKCRVVSVVEEGNTALVTVKVKITGQGWFLVSEGLMKSAWTQTALNIRPE